MGVYFAGGYGRLSLPRSSRGGDGDRVGLAGLPGPRTFPVVATSPLNARRDDRDLLEAVRGREALRRVVSGESRPWWVRLGEWLGVA